MASANIESFTSILRSRTNIPLCRPWRTAYVYTLPHLDLCRPCWFLGDWRVDINAGAARLQPTLPPRRGLSPLYRLEISRGRMRRRPFGSMTSIRLSSTARGWVVVKGRGLAAMARLWFAFSRRARRALLIATCSMAMPLHVHGAGRLYGL